MPDPEEGPIGSSTLVIPVTVTDEPERGGAEFPKMSTQFRKTFRTLQANMTHITGRVRVRPARYCRSARALKPSVLGRRAIR